MGTQYTIPVELHKPLYNGVTTSASGGKKTLALTSDGDLDMGDSGKRPYFISGIEKLKQDVYVIIRSIKGSSSLNPELGIDLNPIILEEYDEQVMETQFKVALLMHPDILAVKGFTVKSTSSYSDSAAALNRKNYVEFHVISTNGEDIFVSVII